MKLRKFTALLLALLTAAAVLTGCDTAADRGADTVLGSGGKTLRIVSGSENRELEPILEDFAKSEGVRIEMTYQGSLDIMRLLEGEELPYDAVWPASSLWLDAADTSLNLKHAESVSITPVVFGIRQSLAQESLTSADLESERLRTQMTELLSGVDRSSGSSDWLKDMFLQGDFDAMVNYECLVIQANQELEAQGREPLYVVYPTDGLTIADSPLAYVDQGDGEKEELFLKLQEYLLSDEIQSAIQRTGRRSSYTGVNEENRDVFREDWGLQPDRVLSPMKMPAQEVLFQALDLYQTEFKKPSLNVYCLDYSGSMAGEGNQQLEAAMEQLLIQSNAQEHFLQASSREVNILIPFSGEPMEVCTAQGNGVELEALNTTVQDLAPGGGTDMYAAALRGLEELKSYDLSQYTPAIILLTDGQSEGSFRAFADAYQELGAQVPVFSIMFGDADESQLEDLAELTNARVFDGREDLVGAFRSVKGYN